MNRLSAIRLATVLAVLTTATTNAEVRWTGWHGPDRTGWVDYFDIPAEWPEKPEQAWKVRVGTGYATPIVAGTRVYQHGREGEEEVVRALDLETGKTLWRKSYPISFKMGGGGQQHGKGPKSSPAFADGRLFTLSITGTLSAWDGESGKLLWRHDFRDRLEKSYPYWGTATSPLIDGERVFVHVGTCEAGALFALDAATGEQIWMQNEHAFCYSSGRMVELEGVRQLLEWNHDGLCGVDPATGKILWDYPYPHRGNNQNTPTPAVHGGLVMAGGENRGMRCIEPQLADGAWSVKEHWRTRDISLDMSTAIMNDGLLYGFSHFKSGQLFCLDPKSGEVQWTGPPRTGENAMLLAIPGHVLALLDTGELRILKATSAKHQVVRSYRFAEGGTWAPPVLLRSGVLIKDREHLTRWDFR